MRNVCFSRFLKSKSKLSLPMLKYPTKLGSLGAFRMTSLQKGEYSTTKMSLVLKVPTRNTLVCCVAFFCFSLRPLQAVSAS